MVPVVAVLILMPCHGLRFPAKDVQQPVGRKHVRKLVNFLVVMPIIRKIGISSGRCHFEQKMIFSTLFFFLKKFASLKA